MKIKRDQKNNTKNHKSDKNNTNLNLTGVAAYATWPLGNSPNFTLFCKMS